MAQTHCLVSTHFFFDSFYLLIYGCLGSALLCGVLSSCGQRGLLSRCGAPASHCGGFSLAQRHLCAPAAGAGPPLPTLTGRRCEQQGQTEAHSSGDSPGPLLLKSQVPGRESTNCQLKDNPEKNSIRSIPHTVSKDPVQMHEELKRQQ